MDEILFFLKEGMTMATSRRLKAIEEAQAALVARVTKVEAEVAALEPANPQVAQDVAVLKSQVFDLNAALDMGDDAPVQA